MLEHWVYQHFKSHICFCHQESWIPWLSVHILCIPAWNRGS